MPLPTTLKELQAICEQRGLKYKGKNKETLKTMLSADITIVDVVNDDENQNIDSLKLKELKDLCGKKGLSKTGNKEELVRRIRSADAEKESEIPVVEWRKRGRTIESHQRSGIV